MTTTEQPADNQAREPELDPILTYRCPGHPAFFPDEDPVRPYTEFVYDHITLLRTHDRSCRRCAKERKRKTTTAPPLERALFVRAKVERALAQLEAEGRGASDEACQARWHLRYLADREQALRGAAR